MVQEVTDKRETELGPEIIFKTIFLDVLYIKYNCLYNVNLVLVNFKELLPVFHLGSSTFYPTWSSYILMEKEKPREKHFSKMTLL